MKLLLSILASFVFTSAVYADHTVENAREISVLAYRAADDAEALEREAFFEAGWGGRDANPQPRDHREENLHYLAQSARDLHLALSDLYRAARYVYPGPTPPDHRGDDMRREFDRAQYSYARLRAAFYELSPYAMSHRLNRLYREVERSMERLTWCVYGDIHP